MSKAHNLIALTLFGAAAACGGDVDPVGTGSLALQWEVSPRGCTQAGVRDVQVQLTGADRVIETFACTDGSGEIDGLKPGNYEMSVFGIDHEQKRTFWVAPQRVTVQGDRFSELDPLRLTARPAEVEVFWTFANGRVCGANDVDEVEIAVYDKLDYEITRQTFECDSGVAPLTGFTAGTFIFEVNAYVAEVPAWRGVETLTVERGEDAEIEVSLGRAD